MSMYNHIPYKNFLTLVLALSFACMTPFAVNALPVSIVDDSGCTVSLKAPAKKIIPLYAAMTETLAAMGMGNTVIARTASDTEVAPHLPIIGTHMRPDPERIAGLQPDLVLILEGRNEAAATAATLSGMGIPVARFRITSFEELFSCIIRLGVLTGSEYSAKTLVAAYSKRLDDVRTRAATLPRTPLVFFEVRYPNLLGAGKKSILTDIIDAAGGKNCLSTYPDTFVRLGEETLISLNPDIYIIQEGAMNKNPIPLTKRPHFRSIQATRSDAVLIVPESVFSRPGPSSIIAAEQLEAYFRKWAQTSEKSTY